MPICAFSEERTVASLADLQRYLSLGPYRLLTAPLLGEVTSHYGKAQVTVEVIE